MIHPAVKYWEYNDLEGLLVGLIGYDYGDNPLENIELIKKDKSKIADIILNSVGADIHSTGMEIGSGVGYLTKLLASRSKHLYACDISQSYLQAAKEYCRELSNITYQLIEPGSLDLFSKIKLDYIFSNNVFIHLNFYEIVSYLQQMRQLLVPGGYVWLDFMEIEGVDILTSQSFLNTYNVLKVDPNNRGCLQFNSSTAVFTAAEKLGYQIEKIHRGDHCSVFLLLKAQA